MQDNLVVEDQGTPSEPPPFDAGDIIEYKILGGERYKVEKEVNQLIQEGWEPFGGICFVEYDITRNEAYAGQAMVKRA